MEIVDAVRRSLDRYEMLAGAKTVLCGLSGGADSVCLMHILRQLAPAYGVQVAAAHFDHRLRGAESARDADFAAALCRDWGVPLYRDSADVADYARRHHLGTEEAARTLRYAFFARCAAKLPCCRIATAHQADDNTEKMLINLLRGAGLKGLGGIPPVRGSVIRPLLRVTRADIDAYLTAHGLSHVEDSSNRTDDYLRNRLRHQVLPALRELNPRVSETVGRTLELLQADEALLSRQAAAYVAQTADGVQLQAADLAVLPAPLASRAVRLAAESFGVQLSQRHTEAALALAASHAGSGSVNLPAGLRAVKDGGILRMTNTPRAAEPAAAFSAQVLPYGVWTRLEEPDLLVFWGSAAELAKIHGKFTTLFFKKVKICGSITVRPRIAGDVIHPAGRGCGKTLKKLLLEAKIPASQRALVPVFADEAGVVAVGSLAADSRAAASPEEADTVLIIMRKDAAD